MSASGKPISPSLKFLIVLNYLARRQVIIDYVYNNN